MPTIVILYRLSYEDSKCFLALYVMDISNVEEAIEHAKKKYQYDNKLTDTEMGYIGTSAYGLGIPPKKDIFGCCFDFNQVKF